jgi:hypothetical protein
LDKETKKRKKKLRNDLDFYLDYYKDVAARSEQIKEAFDREIEEIIEALKEIGK